MILFNNNSYIAEYFNNYFILIIMYIALSLMFVGIILGRIFQNKIKFSLSPYIMVVICLLLAVLGVELGFNNELLSKFKDIGIVSLLISVLTVLGSCIAAKLFSNIIFKREK